MCQKNATHARSQKTLHSHWPDMCPRPAVALCPSNRDVNKISQTFSQCSNIQVFQLQVDSQCLLIGESTSSSFQQARSLQEPSAKNCKICLEMSLAQHHYHCHSFRPATAKLPKLSLLFLEAGCFQKHCHLLAEARPNYISEQKLKALSSEFLAIQSVPISPPCYRYFL